MDYLSSRVQVGVLPTLSPNSLITFRDTARLMLKSANEKYTKYANQSRKSAKFEIGDQVYVSTLSMKTNRPVKKLDYRKIGPYPITESPLK
jgi:hypothetical protein